MSNSNRPKDASIVIPVYNDPEGIETTLQSLTTQLGSVADVVVVDNDSTDNTAAIVEDFIATDRRVRLEQELDILSSYAARNTGIRNTETEVIAFVDADMTVPAGWLETALETFHTAEADYMGCNVDLTLPENPTLPARYDHHTGFLVEQYLSTQHFAPTCCLFVRRSVFEEVGLFDHRLESGGDKEFGNRVYEAGFNQHFAADVRMYHPVRESLQALIKKDRRVGRGLCQLQRYHPDRFGRPGIPPRPSGIKRPDLELPIRDRIAFGTLSKFLTGVRGLGYYREYLTGERSQEIASAIPRLRQN